MPSILNSYLETFELQDLTSHNDCRSALCRALVPSLRVFQNRTVQCSKRVNFAL